MISRKYDCEVIVLKLKKWASAQAVQVMLLLLGVAAVCFGAFRGEVETVLSKAINVCLECIGIG